MLNTTQRTQIEQMVSRFAAAESAGQAIAANVLPMYAAAKALLACNDEAWFASVRKSVALADEAKTLVMAAAQGLPVADIKPLI